MLPDCYNSPQYSTSSKPREHGALVTQVLGGVAWTLCLFVSGLWRANLEISAWNREGSDND